MIFEEFLDEHQQAVSWAVRKARKKYAYARLSEDELYSAALVGLWKALKRLDRTISQKVYVEIKVKREIQSYVRDILQSRIVNKINTIQVNDEELEVNSIYYNKEYEFDNKDEAKVLTRTHLQYSPLRTRIMFYLHWFEQWSLRDIGSVFGVSPSRVYQILKEVK